MAASGAHGGTACGSAAQRDRRYPAWLRGSDPGDHRRCDPPEGVRRRKRGIEAFGNQYRLGAALSARALEHRRWWRAGCCRSSHAGSNAERDGGSLHPRSLQRCVRGGCIGICHGWRDGAEQRLCLRVCLLRVHAGLCRGYDRHRGVQQPPGPGGHGHQRDPDSGHPVFHLHCAGYLYGAQHHSLDDGQPDQRSLAQPGLSLCLFAVGVGLFHADLPRLRPSLPGG